MIVAREEDDYLVCHDLAGQEIHVAQPYMLRRVHFDGRTINSISYVYSTGNVRVASAEGESDETQLVTPFYLPWEEILAVRHDVGLSTTLGKIEWSDLNTAGRCWAAYEE